MKDIVFTAKQQKIEIKVICACIVLANLLNVISIIAYETSWSELWTQLLWVALISGLFYGLSIFFRILYYVIRRFIK